MSRFFIVRLNVIMLSVVKLSLLRLNVVMLSVVAPAKKASKGQKVRDVLRGGKVL